MADGGSKNNDKKISKVERRITAIYSDAQKDIEEKTADFFQRFEVKHDIKKQALKEGKITQEQYNSWYAGQMFQAKQWQAKQEEILSVIDNANKEAAGIVNRGMLDSFAGGANWQAYCIEKGVGASVGFSLYDRDSVARLIADNPDILPKWKIDEPKEYTWNKQKVQNAITQSIIQGETLEETSKRIATALGNNNKNLALTHAQTAMAGAQNAGRNVSLMRAKSIGINVVKEWMATLDKHTRDSHRDMDGERQKVGDAWHPMKFSNGCRFPGDPDGPAHEVFNCRCTLVGTVLDYPESYKRYDNIDGKPIESMSYREWEKAKGLQDKGTPKVTKAQQKKIDKAKTDLQIAEANLSAIEQEIKDKGADKVFHGIWKDDVTYADWETKKGSIQGKRDYYDAQIQHAKQDFYSIFPDEREADEVWGILDAFYGDDVSDDIYAKYEEIKQEFDLDEWKDIKRAYKEARADAHRWEQYMDELDEFEKHGEEYSKLIQQKNEAKTKVKEAKEAVSSLTPKPKVVSPFGEDAYSEERKKSAIKTYDKKEVDKHLRPTTSEVWSASSKSEHHAVYEYTAGSGKFNRPLRGYDGTWERPKGIGAVPLDAERAGTMIKDAVEMIKKSKLPEDIWLCRGVGTDGLASFLGIPKEMLRTGTQEELEQALVGKIVHDSAFLSCGSATGTGFGKDLLIYAPKGTQALYVEPFSAFSGDDVYESWDGTSGQMSFGGEFETLIQRNSFFRVTKVTKRDRWSDPVFEVEVVDQQPDDWSPWE